MVWDAKTREYVLESGRRIRAHGGILGISSDNDMTEGYDGIVPGSEATLYPENYSNTPPMTVLERAEIAAYMAKRWLAWAARSPSTG